MRLTTFHTGDGGARPGVILGEDVAELTGPASIRELLGRPDWAAELPSLVTRSPRRPLTDVRQCAPVPDPPKYLAIGLNAPDHRKDVTVRWLVREPRLLRIAAGYLLAHPRPRHPLFFAKATSSICGPDDPIVLPRDASKVDWEGELAVVVGTRIHDVSPETARRAIAGYLIANDVSVRDWQTDNPTSAAMAKGYPSHGPLGPWLVTADRFDPRDSELRTYLNGELRQRGRIADLILSPAEILSRLSGFCVLEPGDVIACGTFSGTGWPVGRFLRPGDTVRIEVDGIGELTNPVSARPAVTPTPSG
ncbi:fumarylacetoacetate hydrolase family protein [Pseudonocardia spinosispora]|uniref:fumarylacetoacetate hydrolase family protein n=1 Tax=Pseudonocardia spinosispora TaxID=103441 RepID=UPI0004907121|nr:fumarylacetoacetate hydrolase family protein [Pseudonocardia spinosispora]